MKKAYIIHGWGGSPTSEPWLQWLKQELKNRNFQVEIPKMPDTDYPKIDEWIDKLKEIIDLNNEVYLIGHSIGCQAILRFLEIIPENIKINKIIFIAPWFNLLETAYENEEDKEIAKPWLQTPINTEKIKNHTNNILCIFSENDDCVPVSGSKIFKEKFNANIIIKPNEGHFNETKELPEIINFLEND